MIHKVKANLERYIEEMQTNIRHTEYNLSRLKSSLRHLENDLKTLEDTYEGED